MLTVSYELLLEAAKFLGWNDLGKLELTSKLTRKLIGRHRIYWPLNRCYRLTFLEYYAANTLARVSNLTDLPIQLREPLQDHLQAVQLPNDFQIPLFLDEIEPTFLLFEFSSGRKFYVELEPFLNAQNLAKLVFWLDQMANVFFEEEIRGLLDIRKFSPQLLEMLGLHGLGGILHFRCKTFGCYEYAAFDQSSVHFLMNHAKIQLLDKANGTIFSPELLQFLYNGAQCCGAFSTRWVMGCGEEFTDKLIEHALNSKWPEKIVPIIRITPSSHRQRELPIPKKSLSPSGNVWLIKREFGDWKYEEWAVQNVHKGNVRFRVCLFIYNDVETDEEAISQFSIERMA